jgi:hypothetical protein
MEFGPTFAKRHDAAAALALLHKKIPGTYDENHQQ